MRMHFQHLYGEGIVEQSQAPNCPGALFVNAHIELDRSSPEYDDQKAARLTRDMIEFAKRNNFIPLLTQGEIRYLN
jgi:hypothetical protein